MSVNQENATRPVDQAQLDELLGRFVNDLGATISAGNVVVGDKLGPGPGRSGAAHAR